MFTRAAQRNKSIPKKGTETQLLKQIPLNKKLKLKKAIPIPIIENIPKKTEKKILGLLEIIKSSLNPDWTS